MQVVSVGDGAFLALTDLRRHNKESTYRHKAKKTQPSTNISAQPGSVRQSSNSYVPYVHGDLIYQFPTGSNVQQSEDQYLGEHPFLLPELANQSTSRDTLPGWTMMPPTPSQSYLPNTFDSSDIRGAQPESTRQQPKRKCRFAQYPPVAE